MKKIIFISLMFMLCKQSKDDIKSFLEKNEPKYRENTMCSCGKTMDILMNAKSVKLRTPEDLERRLGKWDTSYSEIAVISCSSFVYKCSDKFVAYHFQVGNMKFAGRSYGKIIDGKYEYAGNLMEL